MFYVIRCWCRCARTPTTAEKDENAAAQVQSYYNYYAFGMEMPGRTDPRDNEKYRYGYNGKENDKDFGTAGLTQDYGFRLYNPAIAKFLSVDPLQSVYVPISPYAYSLNSPLMFNDTDGRDAIVTVQKSKTGGGEIIISSIIYITGKNASKEKAERLTMEATRVYKGGTYKGKKGDKWQIKFDIKYEYAEDKTKIKLQKGDNVLDFVDEHINSQVDAKPIQTVNSKGVLKSFKQIIGTTGRIGKKNTEESENYSTIHETLHLLGLSDRYTETIDKEYGDRIVTPNKGFEKDVMGQYYELDINQIHYDNWGKKYSKEANGKYFLTETLDIDTKGNLIGTPPNKKEEKKKTK